MEGRGPAQTEGARRREEVDERLVQAVGGAAVREGPGLEGWALSAPLDAAGALGPFQRAVASARGRNCRATEPGRAVRGGALGLLPP